MNATCKWTTHRAVTHSPISPGVALAHAWMCFPVTAQLRLTAAADYSSAYSVPLAVAVAAAAPPLLCSLPSTTLHRYCPRPCHCPQRSVLPACQPVWLATSRRLRHHTIPRYEPFPLQAPVCGDLLGSLAQPYSAQFPYLLHITNGLRPGRAHRLILTLTPLQVLPPGALICASALR